MDLDLKAIELDQKVAAIISRGIEQQSNQDDSGFNQLALEMFNYQYQANEYYHDLCDRMKITPDNITSWQEIPAIPTQAFKDSIVSSISVENSELALLTSGTTDPGLRGKIFRDKSSLQNIIRANSLITKRYCFPDVEKMPMAMLIPPPNLAPGMAMAFGLGQLLNSFGSEESRYFISAQGLDVQGLQEFLTTFIKQEEPVTLVGATSGFVIFFNHLQKQECRLQLPKGSRVLDGGGYQGTFGNCTREEFYQYCAEWLGVPAHHCINTLGMSESGTNYADCLLADYYAGISPRERQKLTPPWTRTIVVGMRTGKPLPEGEIGLIRHYDLTNRATVMAVQTDNLGYLTEGGFEIIGRAEQATTVKDYALGLGHRCTTVQDQMMAHSHGCSTVVDKMMAHSHGCSTVTDKMMAHSHGCSTVMDEILRK